MSIDTFFICVFIFAVILMLVFVKPVTVEEFYKDDPSKDGGGDMR